MKKNMEKDRKKRLKFLKFEYSRKILKAVSQNFSLPMPLRLRASLCLSSLPRASSLTQIKNRCVLTGRGRFIIGQFGLSRLMLRNLAREGLVLGLRKSSW